MVALVVRLGYLWELRDTELCRTPIGDGRGYDLWAQGIAGLAEAPEGAFFQAPFYPYFLALIYSLVGRELGLVRLVQSLLGAAGCVFLARAGARWTSPRAGWLAGLVLALYPLAVYYDGLIQKTSLAVSLLCVVLYALSKGQATRRPAPLLACGVALGCLTLVRENAAILAPVIAAALLAPRAARGLRSRALDVTWVALGGLIAVTPVAYHNLSQGGGGLMPTTFQFGVNLYIGNGPQADGTYRPLELGHVDYGQEQAAAYRLAEKGAGHELTPAEVSDYWQGKTLDAVRADPGRWLGLMARKWLMTWNGDERMDVESHLAYASESHVLAGLLRALSFTILLPLAAFGAVLTWERRRRLWPLHLALLALTFAVALFFVFGRYRMLLVPPLALLAGGGLDALRRGQQPRRLKAGALAAAVALGVALIPFGRGDLDPRAVTWANLGVALAKAGELERAEPLLLAAVEREPELPQAVVSLGELLFRLQRYDESVQVDQRARDLVPSDSLAWIHVRLRLGAALATLGRHQEALEPLRAVRDREPGEIRVHLLLGECWLGLGDLDQARAAARRALEIEPGSAAARRLLERAER